MGSPIPPVPKKKGLPGWLKKALNILLLVLSEAKRREWIDKSPKP